MLFPDKRPESQEDILERSPLLRVFIDHELFNTDLERWDNDLLNSSKPLREALIEKLSANGYRAVLNSLVINMLYLGVFNVKADPQTLSAVTDRLILIGYQIADREGVSLFGDRILAQVLPLQIIKSSYFMYQTMMGGNPSEAVTSIVYVGVSLKNFGEPNRNKDNDSLNVFRRFINGPDFEGFD